MSSPKFVITGMRFVMPECGENSRVLEIKTVDVVWSKTNGIFSMDFGSESEWTEVPIEVIPDEEFAKYWC